MVFVFGIFGIIGGLLCAVGDVLLDYKGKGNVKLGKHKFIESNWNRMATWRFKLSILFVALGVPMYFLGFTSLAMQMKNDSFALYFWVVCLVGSIGGFFIHSILCVVPILYKKINKNHEFSETEDVLNSVYSAVMFPFITMFSLLVIISSILISFAIVLGYLVLPSWMIVLTPFSMMIIGVLLRIVKRSWFFDLPGIIMPSLGIAMVGLMAVINHRMS